MAVWGERAKLFAQTLDIRDVAGLDIVEDFVNFIFDFHFFKIDTVAV